MLSRSGATEPISFPSTILNILILLQTTEILQNNSKIQLITCKAVLQVSSEFDIMFPSSKLETCYQ